MISKRLTTAGISLVFAFWVHAADAEVRIATAGPMTGPISWFGEQYLRAAEMATSDLNARGGVLGQRIDLIVGDDFCDPNQAIPVARKLASDEVVFVAGHYCSHSSIAASKVYEAAGILQIAPGSASARLTDEGRPNVFRVCGRDDRQGMKVGDHLAARWTGKEIAILNDGTTWGVTSAGSVRRRLQELGVRIAMDETITPGAADYSALILRMQAAGIDVFYVGGLHPDAALIVRQVHDMGFDMHLVGSSAFASEDFSLIAGPRVAGTFMIAATDARNSLQAAEVVARFRAQGYEPQGYTLYVYAAVQVWAEAVATAGSLDIDAVLKVMHDHRFETVLGKIGFDAKGDVTGFDPWQWYVWQSDGTYISVEPNLDTK